MEGLSAGTTFAGYAIEGVLAQGGMGVVYRAMELRPRRAVALKIISPELAAEADFRVRFLRESQLAAEIEHPHVVPVLRVGEENGTLFIAMRLIRGKDLAALIASEGRLNPDRIARIVDQVADALDTAHAKGLIHRDVKPGNVLVEPLARGEHTYLTDFGLMKYLASTSGVTATGALVGTVDYMAPEQFEGEPLDARSDVYSLGCVLFEGLAGRVPYPGERRAARMFAHLTAPPPLVSDLVSGVPREFDDVVCRALAKRPDDRYPSAGDLGRAACAAAEGRSLRRDTERTVATGEAAPDSKLGADSDLAGDEEAETQLLATDTPSRQAPSSPTPAQQTRGAPPKQHDSTETEGYSDSRRRLRQAATGGSRRRSRLPRRRVAPFVVAAGAAGLGIVVGVLLVGASGKSPTTSSSSTFVNASSYAIRVATTWLADLNNSKLPQATSLWKAPAQVTAAFPPNSQTLRKPNDIRNYLSKRGCHVTSTPPPGLVKASTLSPGIVSGSGTASRSAQAPLTVHLREYADKSRGANPDGTRPQQCKSLATYWASRGVPIPDSYDYYLTVTAGGIDRWAAYLAPAGVAREWLVYWNEGTKALELAARRLWTQHPQVEGPHGTLPTLDTLGKIEAWSTESGCQLQLDPPVTENSDTVALVLSVNGQQRLGLPKCTLQQGQRYHAMLYVSAGRIQRIVWPFPTG